MPGSRQPAKVPIGQIVAACVAAGIAHLGTSTMPFQIGALMDGNRLSASTAGTFGFCEIGALAGSMLLISPIIHRLSPALVAAAGAAIGICAHLILFASTGSLLLLFGAALLAGCGYGLVFAAMVSGTAASKRADRIYAIANCGALVVIVALMACLPQASARFGPLGPFLGIALLLAATAPAYLGFRGVARASLRQSGSIRAIPGVVPLLTIWTCFSLGAGAAWSFAERIGHTLRLPPETIGYVLSAATFCGILGSGLTGLISERVPRLGALATGLIGTAFACALLGFSWNLVSYALSVFFYWIFYMFLYPFLLGSAAALDPTGRVGTAGGGFERFGFGLGAPLGGLLVDHASFGALGIFSAIACVGLLPVCLAPLRRAFPSKA